MLRLEYEQRNATTKPPRLLGPTGVIVLLWMPLLWFSYASAPDLLYDLVNRCVGARVVSCNAYLGTGNAITPVTIRGHLFGSFILCLAGWLYLTAIRCFAERVSRAGYWVFALPAVVITLYMLVFLTIPYWWLVLYVRDMGITSSRVKGLVSGAGAYLAILAFAYWAIRPPRR